MILHEHEIFSSPVNPEMPFLNELAWDLDESLRAIAYGEDYAEDIEWIRGLQQEMAEVYGEGVPNIRSDVGQVFIVPAYERLQLILDGNPTPEEIRREAEDIITDELTPKEPDEEYLRAFGLLVGI